MSDLANIRAMENTHCIILNSLKLFCVAACFMRIGWVWLGDEGCGGACVGNGSIDGFEGRLFIFYVKGYPPNQIDFVRLRCLLLIQYIQQRDFCGCD